MEDHHHHIICKECGQVVEFQFCDISRWSKKLMKATGYQMTGHQLSLYGVCESCRQAE
jgi:Fe2+ or Zn2+ uptake regulation protein